MTTRSQPLLPPPVNGEHRLRSENLAFDIDVWYPPLAAHTFPTIFLPLTRCEAAAIVAYYDTAWRHIQGKLTHRVINALEELEARIDAAIKGSFFEPNDGVFLRLCGRSPKDGEPTDPTVRAKVWKSYQSALQKMLDEGQPADDNTRAAAIAKTDSWLHVRSGSDAMSLILTSERVFSDMLDWLHYGEPEQIVLRQWSDAFDLSSEFRCYIRQGELVGISQYDTYARFAFLQEASRRTMIIRTIVQEWVQVKDCIETMNGSYCVDFGVSMENGTAQLIELSPFRRCTGPALFKWKDKTTLIFPEGPDVLDDLITNFIVNDHQKSFVACNAVFRVRSQAVPRIGCLVEMNWDMRWSKERVDTPKPYRDWYSRAIPTNISLWDRMHSWWLKQQQHVLFVYGTLKRNCHWHGKYMMGAQFLGCATTVKPYPLVIGQCGVPYMLGIALDDAAKPVQGELWSITSEMLRGIDEYEGLGKGHYSREEILVYSSKNNRRQQAFVYVYAIKRGESDVDTSLLEAKRISEYSVEEQKKLYKPIHHIEVKQLQYLGEEATT